MSTVPKASKHNPGTTNLPNKKKKSKDKARANHQKLVDINMKKY
jgi:hypothetical protein